MRDELRYRLIDEPRPNFLSRMAIPPLLAFLAATFFQPWGYLLLVYNAIALNGPQRNREIAFSLLPFPLFYGALELAVGIGLASAAFAFISQSRTFELRRYLAELGGHSA